jgi:hypothetical protein
VEPRSIGDVGATAEVEPPDQRAPARPREGHRLSGQVDPLEKDSTVGLSQGLE